MQNSTRIKIPCLQHCARWTSHRAELDGGAIVRFKPALQITGALLQALLAQVHPVSGRSVEHSVISTLRFEKPTLWLETLNPKPSTLNPKP